MFVFSYTPQTEVRFFGKNSSAGHRLLGIRHENALCCHSMQWAMPVKLPPVCPQGKHLATDSPETHFVCLWFLYSLMANRSEAIELFTYIYAKDDICATK